MSLSRPNLIVGMCCALLAFAMYMSVLDARQMQSADLYALWLASEFLSMGQPDQVYPATHGLFDMTPPDGWLSFVVPTDPDARIFPYIYPPLWAAIGSHVTPLMTFAIFDQVFFVLHQALLIGTAFLALQMCGLRGVSLLTGVVLTYAGLVLTMPIGIALGENQPQIIVSFLIIAAFERAQAKNPKLAGALLALAAAIKVYPLLFVVIFVARRNWSVVASFALVGAVLGLLSIGLAGWALHAEYLSLLSVVGRSVIVTNFSYSIDALLAVSVFPDAMIQVDAANVASDALGWQAIAKTPMWATLSGVAQLSAIAGVGILAARRPNDPLVMPLAAALFALLSPLSWAYTYLTTFVFLGPLAVRLGRFGMVVPIAILVVFHPVVAGVSLDIHLNFAFSSTTLFWTTGLGVILFMTATLAYVVLWRPATKDVSSPQ